MTKVTKLVSDTWPSLKGINWPADKCGPQPEQAAITDALTYCRAGTAVSLSNAMRLRACGIVEPEVKTAVLLAGFTSGQHVNKTRDGLYAGTLVLTAGHMTAHGQQYAGAEQLDQRGGHTVTRIALKAKAPKAVTKVSGKATGKRKAAAKVTKPKAKAKAPVAAPVTPSTPTEGQAAKLARVTGQAAS